MSGAPSAHSSLLNARGSPRALPFATWQGCRTSPAPHQKACGVAAASSVVLASLRERLTRTSVCLPRYAPRMSPTTMTTVRTQQDSCDTEPNIASRCMFSMRLISVASAALRSLHSTEKSLVFPGEWPLTFPRTERGGRKPALRRRPVGSRGRDGEKTEGSAAGGKPFFCRRDKRLCRACPLIRTAGAVMGRKQ